MKKRILSLVLVCTIMISQLGSMETVAMSNKALSTPDAGTASYSNKSVLIETGIKGLTMLSSLTNWVSDDAGKYIYAISSDDKKLFEINANSLDIEGVLQLASSPSDIIIDGYNLYIALPDINQIIIVNGNSGDYIKTLYTSSCPYRIVIDGTKLYYTEQAEGSYINEYDLTTNSDKRLLDHCFHDPDLAINTNLHLLYIGESDLSRSEIRYYNTKTNELIGIGDKVFDMPSRTILFDGKYVFYAGRAFDPQNPSKIVGTYTTNQNIKCVNNGIVFTSYQFFNENNFKGIYYLLDKLDLVLLSNTGKLFLYSNEYQCIFSFESLNRYIKYVLDKPTNVKAVSTSLTSIKLSWDKSYNVAGYNIYRSTSNTGTFSYIGKTTTTSYTDSSLTAGKTYYYKVIAYISYNGNNVFGSYSSVIFKTAAPPAPSAPKAASASYNSIKISWNAVNGASGYAVYRYNAKTKVYDKIKTTTSTSYTNTSLTTGTVYSYKVKAYKTVNKTNVYSDNSSVASAKPVPATPGSFKVNKVTKSSIKLTWSAVSGATGYEIYRKDPVPSYNGSSSVKYVFVKATSSTSFTITGDSYFIKSSYKVRAYRTVNGVKIFGAYTSDKHYSN